MINLLNVFDKVEKLGSPSFHPFRWLKGSARDLRGTPAAYSKKNQKFYQKKCQKVCEKECQKICQKECQKICQKEHQKIASSQSAKLRVTERISADELYVYLHLTRSGWHEI